MPRLSLVVCLALFPSLELAAQVVPDTTDPAAYYPLEVGNRWEYEPDGGSPTPYATHFRRTIIGDTLIEGETWFIQRDQGFRGPAYAWERMTDERQVLRFDPDSAAVLLWRAGEIEWWTPCRMDGPMGPSECEPSHHEGSRNKTLETVSIGAAIVETVRLSFFTALPGPNLAAGVGELGGQCEGGCASVLVYASVGDSTYGTPVQGMPDVPHIRWPAIPDTTSPARYAPLEVGNVWHYRDTELYGWVSREVQRVVRDSTVNDTTYAVVESQRYWRNRDGNEGQRFDTQLLRFDSAAAVVRRQVEESEQNAPYAHCRFDTPFPNPKDGYRFCTGLEGEAMVFGSPSEQISIGDTVITVAAKAFDILGHGTMRAAGIGRVSTWYDGSLIETRLEYALINGRVYGTPLPGFPAVVSSSASPTPHALTLRAFPSPSAGPITLLLASPYPQSVELAAFDALGRRVWHRELMAGHERIQIDASPWAPGLYLVRAVAGDASATATVVRR
ncbi:MAG: hypothetical protein AAF170_09925 [Bacteroidota bacterium]